MEWTEIGDDPGRRILNVLLAGALLLLAFPVMVLIGIAIKLTSKGPILYTTGQMAARALPGTCHDSKNYSLTQSLSLLK